MAPKYKLIYIDIRGRAEMTRILFHAAGQEFEDKRISIDEVPEMKKTLPFGQLPVLEVEGKLYAQSFAIANYVAREFGFYGQSNLEGLQIDQVTQRIQDFQIPLVQAILEKDPIVKEQLMNTLKRTYVPDFLRDLHKLLLNNRTEYFAGSKMSFADIAVFDTVDTIRALELGDLDNYPHVKDIVDKVTSHPNIARYLKSRK